MFSVNEINNILITREEETEDASIPFDEDNKELSNMKAEIVTINENVLLTSST